MEDLSRRVDISRYSGDWTSMQDHVVVEEPLEIRLGFTIKGRYRQQSISITMRTPGADFELALGFLFTEQILTNFSQVKEVVHCDDGNNKNVVRVELHDGVSVELGRITRNFYTTSSCGVCGKSSLEALSLTGYKSVVSKAEIGATCLEALPNKLLEHQRVFDQTGGLHAAGLFTLEGGLIEAFEDVGRHNALDKLIGSSWMTGKLPLASHALILSGRASFELLQKAVAGGIAIVGSVGAPSSLAIEVAQEFNVTLAGFVRDGRFNVYSGAERITS